MIYPILLLVFMTRKKFVAAFAAGPVDAEVVAAPDKPSGQP